MLKLIAKALQEMKFLRKKLTIFILFKPAVHKIINSFSFSNFLNCYTNDIKNDKGINFVKIFGTFSKE